MSDSLTVSDFVTRFDDASLSGKAAAADFKKQYIVPCKGDADKLEIVRRDVIAAASVVFFTKERTISGKKCAAGSKEMDKVSAAFYAAKGVKLTDAQKKLRHAVQMYANNIWNNFKLGGERPKKTTGAAKSGASAASVDASKTETTGAVSSPEGAEKSAIVQGQGVTAVELATAVYNWLAVHRDINDRQDLARELVAVLNEAKKWQVNQAVELRQVI